MAAGVMQCSKIQNTLAILLLLTRLALESTEAARVLLQTDEPATTLLFHR
jgi:hypothetical protein